MAPFCVQLAGLWYFYYIFFFCLSSTVFFGIVFLFSPLLFCFSQGWPIVARAVRGSVRSAVPHQTALKPSLSPCPGPRVWTLTALPVRKGNTLGLFYVYIELPASYIYFAFTLLPLLSATRGKRNYQYFWEWGIRSPSIHIAVLVTAVQMLSMSHSLKSFINSKTPYTL